MNAKKAHRAAISAAVQAVKACLSDGTSDQALTQTKAVMLENLGFTKDAR